MAKQRTGVRLGTLTPEDLCERLSEVIEGAYDFDSTVAQRINHEVPANELESVLGHWQYGVLNSFVQWDCDSDTCPARPAWQNELDELLMGDSEAQTRLQEQMADVMRGWLMKRLMAFAAAHPEARLNHPG